MREILNDGHVPVPVRLTVDISSVESNLIQPVISIMLKSARYFTQEEQPKKSQWNKQNIIGIQIKHTHSFQEVCKLFMISSI